MSVKPVVTSGMHFFQQEHNTLPNTTAPDIKLLLKPERPTFSSGCYSDRMIMNGRWPIKDGMHYVGLYSRGQKF